MKILIADDDVTSRLVLTGVLKKCGHDVVVRVDGTEAWEAMRRPDAPALAILDWMMPGLAGVEVCRRVRSLQSDQPPYIIILTSKGEKADIVAGLEAGADDYLAKPFDPGELRARVDVGRRMIELQARLREAHDALAHEATHDPLTGTLNRRAFADVLSRALSEEASAPQWPGPGDLRCRPVQEGQRRTWPPGGGRGAMRACPARDEQPARARLPEPLWRR